MGVRGNHLFGGVDYLFGSATPEFFMGVDTMGSLDEPSPACDSGVYYSDRDTCAPSGYFDFVGDGDMIITDANGT